MLSQLLSPSSDGESDGAVRRLAASAPRPGGNATHPPDVADGSVLADDGADSALPTDVQQVLSALPELGPMPFPPNSSRVTYEVDHEQRVIRMNTAGVSDLPKADHAFMLR